MLKHIIHSNTSLMQTSVTQIDDNLNILKIKKGSTKLIAFCMQWGKEAWPNVLLYLGN